MGERGEVLLWKTGQEGAAVVLLPAGRVRPQVRREGLLPPRTVHWVADGRKGRTALQTQTSRHT